ncbi:MAG: FAD-dependent oxidoreductase [Candidatus Poribacteria bacterium]
MASELELSIKEIIQRTHNVKSFRLELSNDVDFKSGQYMMVTVKANGKDVSRYLSISNSPTEKGYLEFTKKLTNSDFSQTLNQLKVGDMAKVKYAFGKFTFNGEYDKIAFLSGGIGITPIRSIAKYVVDKNLGTDMILVYGNQCADDVAFKEDFDQMQKDYAKLKVLQVLLDDSNCDWHEVKTGFITKEIVLDVIPDYKERKFFICGPPAMVDAMRKILLDGLGLDKECVIEENFKGY